MNGAIVQLDRTPACHAVRLRVQLPLVPLLIAGLIPCRVAKNMQDIKNIIARLRVIASMSTPTIAVSIESEIKELEKFAEFQEVKKLSAIRYAIQKEKEFDISYSCHDCLLGRTCYGHGHY